MKEGLSDKVSKWVCRLDEKSAIKLILTIQMAKLSEEAQENIIKLK